MPRHMRMRCAGVLLFALSVIVPAGLLQATAASADTQCATEIVDGANLYKGDLSSVQKAVDDLRAKGADVRVRTMNGFAPYPSLDSYLTAQRSQCKGNWSNDDGSLMKGNLVVLGISNSSDKAQRALQLYYGSDWHGALKDNGEAIRIQSEVIPPYFRNGDFAGGTAAGLESVAEAIDSYRHPANNAGGGSTGPTYEAPDLSGLWTWLGWLLGVIVAGVLGFFGIRWFSNRRALEAERVTARGNALRERDAASTIIADLHNPTRDAVRKSKVGTLIEADPAREREYEDLLDDYQHNIDNAELSMTRAATSYEGADNDKLTTEQYQSMTPMYAKALSYATAAKKSDDQINALTSELDGKLANLPATTTALQNNVSRLSAEVSAFVDKGYHDDGIGDKLGRLSETVASFGQSKATLQQYKAVSDAEEIYDHLNDDFTKLSTKVQSVVGDVAKLPELVASARQALPEARASFERVSATYAEDSWRSVAGNGTEAEKRFNAADQLIAKAQAATSLDSQKWNDAEKLVAQTRETVRDGQALLVAITERESHLAKAKQTAQAEIDAAQRDIDKAASYEHEFDDDIRDSLRDDIAKARRLLGLASDELSKSMPNYLRVVDFALQANKAADDAYAECASEHEAAERLRQQAVSSVQLAEASISKADSYIDNHSDDVEENASKHLRRAKKLFAQAQQVSKPADIVQLATEALAEARTAYNQAENDFNDAEAERERIREEERRRRRREEEAEERRRSSNNTAIIVGGYGGGWGSGSSSGGSSWDSGSGSSTNFGGFSGSDGGSGSSTGW